LPSFNSVSAIDFAPQVERPASDRDEQVSHFAIAA
jgi:hypothetical protein